MRITQRAIALTSLQGLNRNLDAVGKLQQQLTSGKTISKPSDSPTGTNAAMQTRQDAAVTAQYARNISDGKGQLDATDSALQTMLEQARRVRDLTVQGLNSGSLSDAARQSIAAEVTGLRQSLLGLANSSFQGQPLFGGVTTGTRAYDDNGGYTGVGGNVDSAGTTTVPVVPVMRRVSKAEEIRVDITGPEAFRDKASGKDLFSVVAAIGRDVTADPAALSGHLGDLDAVMNTMLTAAADIGTRSARMETADQINSDLSLTLTTRQGEIEDVDLPKVIMELQMQQTGYQAALSATAKVIPPTLVDFLR
jgi:flagellar hook-associated protein 3 FlgL